MRFGGRVSILLVLCAVLLFGDADKASTKPKQALGLLFSYGEGRGILYRSYLASGYIQQAGYLYLSKDSETTSAAFDYALSYGRYFYELHSSKLSLKGVGSLEALYDLERYSFGTNSYNNEHGSITLALGVGIEYGAKQKDRLFYGLDLLYNFELEDSKRYSIYPAVALYIGYNF